MENRLRRFLIGLAILGIACLSMLFGWFSSNDSLTTKITIYTGTDGGTYSVIGKALQGVLDRQSNQNDTVIETKPTRGAVDNARRVHDDLGGIGFVVAPALRKDGKLKVLSKLYQDSVQIVVNRKNGVPINRLEDLRNRTVFLGPEGSGTRLIAEGLLESIDVEVNVDDEPETFMEAAKKISVGHEPLDAAFFVSGMPTGAVKEALRNPELSLLSISDDELEKILTRFGKSLLKEIRIPANTYLNQPDDVVTLGADVFLVCNEKLGTTSAFEILDSIFDNVLELLYAHAKAQEIRVISAFEGIDPDLLHPGAKRFQAAEESKLLIATGTARGKYFQLGKIIEELLRQENIPSRCIHTDGSIENLHLLLSKSRPTIALMQADVALAAKPGMAPVIYGETISESNRSPSIFKKLFEIASQFDNRSIRRIATLHHERLYAVIRKTEHKKDGNQSSPSEFSLAKMFDSSSDLPICVGPKDSGTQLIAMAVLETAFRQQKAALARDQSSDNGTLPPPRFPKTICLSATDMLAQLQSQQIQGAFFVTGEPTQLYSTLLNDPNLQLISIDSSIQSQLVAGPAFETDLLAAGTFPCQEQSDTQTIKTRTILVTADGNTAPSNIEEITSAIIRGRSYLQIDEKNPSAMAVQTPMVKLHSEAKAAYLNETDWFPKEKKWGWLEWVSLVGQVLTVIVALFAVMKGSLIFRRDSTSNEIGRRIMAINVDENEPDSISKLKTLRKEIKQRVQRRWWSFGEIDKARWQRNDDFIASRLKVAKEKLTLSLVAEVLAITSGTMGDERKRPELISDLRKKTVKHLHREEIDGAQMQLVIDLLETLSQSDVDEIDLEDLGAFIEFVNAQNRYLSEHKRAKPFVAFRKVEEKALELGLSGKISTTLNERTIKISRSTPPSNGQSRR